MADIKQFLSYYDKYRSTFKETSFDDKNGVYLCSDKTQRVINFDKVIADIYPNSKDYRPKTFDAIFIDENNIYCIEFKKEKKPKKEEIEQKLVDGKKALDRLLGELNIQKKDYKFIFCLVYNIHKPQYSRYKRGILSYPIKTYLQSYKESGFIDAIFTEDIDFYKKIFQKKINIQLGC